MGLRVTLRSVTVSGASPDSRVVVEGTVSNPSNAPIYGVRVSLLRSADPYRSLAAVQNALGGQHGTSSGAVAARPTHWARLTSPTKAIAPGKSVSFSLSGTLAELGLSANASYWVGAQATGAPRPGGGSVSALTGESESLATVPDTVGPTVVTIVELKSTPRRLRANLFADDDLADELGPDGRLGVLLDAVVTRHYDYLVDPELLDEVTDMADGYRVVDGEEAEDGEGQEAAQEWLDAFASLPKESGLQQLYGDPDLVGAGADASKDILTRALDATRDAGRSLTVVAAPRRVSRAALSDLAGRGIAVISPAVDSGSPWVLMGGAKVSGVYAPSSAPSEDALGGGEVGRTAAAVALARAVGTQVRLLSSPADLRFDDTTPDWVVRRHWSDVAAADPVVQADPPAAQSVTGGLTKSLAGRLDRLSDQLTAYGSVAPRSGLGPLADRLASSGASEAWLTDPKGRTDYLDEVDSRSGVNALAGGITVSVTPTVVLASSTNPFPATITNHLPDSITVRVVGVSGNSARMGVESSQLVTVRPNDSDTVQLTATARANGAVRVQLHAESEEGLRVSAEVPVTLEATNLGFVGWIIVGLSAVVLVVSTALRIRQVRRRQTP